VINHLRWALQESHNLLLQSSVYRFSHVISFFDIPDPIFAETYPMKTLPWSELLHADDCQGMGHILVKFWECHPFLEFDVWIECGKY